MLWKLHESQVKYSPLIRRKGVSTERPVLTRKRTYLQHNIFLLQSVNSAMKKADSFLISNVISSARLHTSSLSSFSFHCQESSVDSLSPSHCDCKETNVDFFSSPHQESSLSFDAD